MGSLSDAMWNKHNVRPNTAMPDCRPGRSVSANVVSGGRLAGWIAGIGHGQSPIFGQLVRRPERRASGWNATVLGSGAITKGTIRPL